MPVKDAYDRLFAVTLCIASLTLAAWPVRYIGKQEPTCLTYKDKERYVVDARVSNRTGAG